MGKYEKKIIALVWVNPWGKLFSPEDKKFLEVGYVYWQRARIGFDK
jgi:hypothetical protein